MNLVVLFINQSQKGRKMKFVYGLIGLMIVSMVVSTSEAHEGLFARWRAVRFGGSSGAAVSGGSNGYSVSGGCSGTVKYSSGSNGGSNSGCNGGSTTSILVLPSVQVLVPISSPVYETTPVKILPRVLPRIRANCLNGVCPIN